MSPAPTNVVAVSITDAGRGLTERLPYERTYGDLAAVVRARWADVDGFVLFCATGVAVRIIAPLLTDKHSDPSVVCVDEAGRFAVALCGGHAGANTLAREVAALIGAEPVVTTATDSVGIPALDELPGFVAGGDIAGVSRAILDGSTPVVGSTLSWPIPLVSGSGPGRVIVTDSAVEPADMTVALHPPSLVVGVGASSDAPTDAATDLLHHTLAEAGLSAHSVALVATVDRRAHDPVIAALALPMRSFTASELKAIDVPHPSELVDAAVGTPSVAEAAALLAAGPGAELVVPKHKNATATVAIARRAGPAGSVSVVGLGPGDPRHRTAAASAAIRAAEVVVGYDLYVEQCQNLLTPAQTVICSPIGAEADRCRIALDRAAAGTRVALVCSGDPGVFAMATLVHELAPEFANPTVEVVPGVTAASAAAALLGAPLAHDHAFLSLSDLLTPWPLIERRLRAVAEGDLAVALYNPRSARRTWQLESARIILLEHRPPSTPVGIVTDATRPGQEIVLTTLDQLDVEAVTMLSIVIVGSSTTTEIGGHLVTPRGYAR